MSHVLQLPEIISLVEPAGKRILEIGCGTGSIGAALREAGAAEVVGIEPDAAKATEARKHLTATYTFDLESLPPLPYPHGYFDAVTLVSGALENVREPARLLATIRRYVRDDGHVVCAVPNVRHEAVLFPLLFKGSFNSQHARLFTRNEAENILLAAGFEVVKPLSISQTEPSKIVGVMRDLVASAGGNSERFAEEATTPLFAFVARVSQATGAKPSAIPDMWVTTHSAERVLVLPQGDTNWESTLREVVKTYAGTGRATLGIPLSPKDFASPPASISEIIGDDVDAVIMEAPANDDGWMRLAAGATSVVVAESQSALDKLVKHIGVAKIAVSARAVKRVSPAAHFKSPTTGDDKSRYLDLMKRVLTNVIYGDADLYLKSNYDLDRRAGGLDWPANAHTMVGIQRLDNLQMCIEDVIKRGVPGDFIETGVWRGGATILMRAILAAYGDTERKVWVADSFEGLPPPNPELYPADAGDKHFTKKELAVSMEDVQHHFEVYGLLDDQVRFLKGWFKDTLPTAPIDKLAVVRLDGDMYESTMDGIRALYPKLSVGGYLIVDDFHAVAGCRKAIEDYRREFAITDEMKPIDRLAVYWKRTK